MATPTREPMSPLVPGIVWLACYFGARALLEAATMPPALRAAVALVPVLPFLWFLVAFVRGIQQTDELEQRIQLEALALAFPLCVVMLMTLGLLELAVPLDRDDWSYRHVWAFMPLFYFLGLARARRRYS